MTTYGAWMTLLAAGCCEVMYAAAIPRTEGFTRLWPSLYCALFIVISLYLLSLAVRSLPVGTAYAGGSASARWARRSTASRCSTNRPNWSAWVAWA